MIGAPAAGEAQTHTRFAILPDRGSNIGSGIVGGAFLFAGAYFELGLISILFIALGAFCVVSAILSSRGLSSLPRIEIDNNGIRQIWLFGAKSIEWRSVAWLEPHLEMGGENADQHSIRVQFVRSAGAAANRPPREQYHLNLDCFLSRAARNLDATTWITDWLEELRREAVSGTNALQRLRHPKYLKGRFV